MCNFFFFHFSENRNRKNPGAHAQSMIYPEYIHLFTFDATILRKVTSTYFIAKFPKNYLRLNKATIIICKYWWQNKNSTLSVCVLSINKIRITFLYRMFNGKKTMKCLILQGNNVTHHYALLSSLLQLFIILIFFRFILSKFSVT